MDINEFITKIVDDTKLPPKKYEKPFIIALSGHCGSGKSHVAKVLSKELQLYIVGGDSVRIKIRKEKSLPQDDNYINELTNKICYLKIQKLLDANASIVIDKSTSSIKDLENLRKYNVPIILIKLISDHDQNRKRVTERSNTQMINIPGYGDLDSISNIVTPELYDIVVGRKVYDIPDTEFDYIIDARVPLEEELKEAEKIAKEIIKMYK